MKSDVVILRPIVQYAKEIVCVVVVFNKAAESGSDTAKSHRKPRHKRHARAAWP